MATVAEMKSIYRRHPSHRIEPARPSARKMLGLGQMLVVELS